MDCSPPDSSVHGIFQARVLEWGAILGKEPVPGLVVAEHTGEKAGLGFKLTGV